MKIHPRFKLNGKSYSTEALEEVANGLLNNAPFEKVIGEFILEWLNSSESITVSTSGSTGNPKKIHLKKEQLFNSAIATGTFFKLKEGDTALLCLPCDFIAGKMMLVRAMVLGLELDYVAPSSQPLIHNTKKYDFAAMIPLQATNSIKELELIDKLIIGGAPINTALENKLKGLKTSIFETYGMTETITHIAVKAINFSAVGSSAVETYLGTPLVEKLTNFKALTNVTFSIDERECLVIDAPKVSSEVVVTNDIINLISKTSFVWLGRYDNVINSGGIKLVPEQIEAKLSDYITNRFFVAGLEDDALGQKLVLVIESSSDSKSILEKIKENKVLERYEIPKAVFSLPQFSITRNGKIRRTETLKLLNR